MGEQGVHGSDSLGSRCSCKAPGSSWPPGGHRVPMGSLPHPPGSSWPAPGGGKALSRSHVCEYGARSRRGWPVSSSCIALVNPGADGCGGTPTSGTPGFRAGLTWAEGSVDPSSRAGGKQLVLPPTPPALLPALSSPVPLPCCQSPLHPAGARQHPCPMVPRGPGVPVPGPSPATPFSALRDRRVARGVPALLGVSLRAGALSASNGAHMGGFAALPSPGQRRFPHALKTLCVPQGWAGARAGQRVPSHAPLRRVALQICRVGTARQPPAAPYLQPDTPPWTSTAGGRAAAPGGPHTSSTVPTWGLLGPPSAPRGAAGCRAMGQGLPPCTVGAEQAQGPTWMGIVPWCSPGAGRAWGTLGDTLPVSLL